MTTQPPSPLAQDGGQSEVARALLRGPAIGLIVSASICLVCVGLAMAFSAFLLASGMTEHLPEPSTGMSKSSQVWIRFAWGGAMFAANVVILIAAVQMLRVRKYGLAKTGAILAVIPCIGPCLVLGIPFGIWALVTLGKSGVRTAFR